VEILEDKEPSVTRTQPRDRGSFQVGLSAAMCTVLVSARSQLPSCTPTAYFAHQTRASEELLPGLCGWAARFALSAWTRIRARCPLMITCIRDVLREVDDHIRPILNRSALQGYLDCADFGGRYSTKARLRINVASVVRSWISRATKMGEADLILKVSSTLNCVLAVRYRSWSNVLYPVLS